MENLMIIVAIVMVLVVCGWIVYEVDTKVEDNVKHQAHAAHYHQLREEITMERIGKKQMGRVTSLQLYKARKELSTERSRNLMRNRHNQ